ncbi:MAG: MOSC domain-containing protein, partial [Bacteroidota bacterium]
SRCVLPTVDQNTGIKGEEPLRTLSTYRTRDNEVYFGQNLIAANTGTVGVADRVEVLEWR